jgi:hypothetical protein
MIPKSGNRFSEKIMLQQKICSPQIQFLEKIIALVVEHYSSPLPVGERSASTQASLRSLRKLGCVRAG